MIALECPPRRARPTCMLHVCLLAQWHTSCALCVSYLSCFRSAYRELLALGLLMRSKASQGHTMQRNPSPITGSAVHTNNRVQFQSIGRHFFMHINGHAPCGLRYSRFYVCFPGTSALRAGAAFWTAGVWYFSVFRCFDFERIALGPFLGLVRTVRTMVIRPKMPKKMHCALCVAAICHIF